MNRLTTKQLGFIRNMIIIVGMVLALILWLCIPAVVGNNSLVHAGNGQYGSKLGFLLLIPIPLFALIPRRPGDEIHTEDAAERAKLENEWETQSRKLQIAYAAAGVITACFCMLLVMLLG